MSKVISNSSSKRNLTVLAVVVACFAVLWPKIFYPMLISIISPLDEEESQDEIRKLDFFTKLHPQMREAMGEARPLDLSLKDSNKAIFHPSVRYAAKPQSKSPGLLNIVIPIYTIAVILFFIYSLIKTFLKKNQKSQVLANMKQQKSKSMLQCPEKEDSSSKRKDIIPDRKAQRALEQYGKHKVLTALKTIILEMEDFKDKPSNNSKKHVTDVNCKDEY